MISHVLNTYKNKMDNFLERLQLNHHEFYTRLTEEEQKSFAVCVAEILTQGGLITRSDYGGGLFGVLCCVNAGWPAQLNLKKFGAQSVAIADQAVNDMSWKGAAVAQKEYQMPIRRWTYVRP